MSCRFYGKNGMAGRLVDSLGNECALMLVEYAPCGMEIEGDEPDEDLCPRFETAARMAKLFARAQGD